MNRTKSLATGVATAIFLTASGAALALSDKDENAGKLAAITNAKTSMTQAIMTAETKTGGRAVKADFDDEDGGYHYKIKTGAFEVIVDPQTGAITEVEEDGFLSRIIDRNDEHGIKKLSAMSFNLVNAVVAAEARTGGKAVEAELRDKPDNLSFKVEVATGTMIKDVTVDAVTGQVTGISENDDDDKDD